MECILRKPSGMLPTPKGQREFLQASSSQYLKHPENLVLKPAVVVLVRNPALQKQREPEDTKVQGQPAVTASCSEPAYVRKKKMNKNKI